MKRKRKTNKQVMLRLWAAWWVIALLFYWAAGEGIYRGAVETDMLSAKDITPVIRQGDILTQRFRCDADTIEAVKLYCVTYGRPNTDLLSVRILDEDGQTAALGHIDTAELAETGIREVVFDTALEDARGRKLCLEITSERGSEENGISFYYGSSIATLRADVPVQIDQEMMLFLNGEASGGQLCFSIHGINYFMMGVCYWPVVIVAGLFLAGYFVWTERCEKAGQKKRFLIFAEAWRKYSFLMRQLIKRDFKTKYKRSVLGAFWSFLNPLLTMLVQYLVFSTIFKSDIENFPVYLLTGIVTFGYFSEVSNMCLVSIIGNAGLISKVYVPKIIYPLSKALSCTVNFFFSLFPLLVVILLTRTPLTKAMLLVPFVVFCTFLFSLGIGLILSVLMTFFRDTQFLWGVVSMIWTYATPIFYPESILPENFLFLFKLNPMYHFIRAVRTMLIQGVSPEPKAYLYCLIGAIVPLCAGLWLFRKNEDQFIFYI